MLPVSYARQQLRAVPADPPLPLTLTTVGAGTGALFRLLSHPFIHSVIFVAGFWTSFLDSLLDFFNIIVDFISYGC